MSAWECVQLCRVLEGQVCTGCGEGWDSPCAVSARVPTVDDEDRVWCSRCLLRSQGDVDVDLQGALHTLCEKTLSADDAVFAASALATVTSGGLLSESDTARLERMLSEEE